MKKLICALFGVFITFGAFADNVLGPSVNSEKNVGKTMNVSWEDINTVITQEGFFPNEKYDAMLERFSKIAGIDDISAEWYRTAKITTSDAEQLCLAGGEKDMHKCYDHFVLPLATQVRSRILFNACDSGNQVKLGYRAHCIDNVFVKKGKGSNNVNLPEWTAYGFAIEKTRYLGESLSGDGEVELGNTGVMIPQSTWDYLNIKCSPKHEKNYITCYYGFNGHYFTYKFAGLDNDTDHDVYANTVAGICSFFGIDYFGGNFDGALANTWACNLPCSSCLGLTENKFLNKFGMESDITMERDPYEGVTYEEAAHIVLHPNDPMPGRCWIRRANVVPDTLKTYPEREYMTMAFEDVQTVLNQSTIYDMLKKYVEMQEVDLHSFFCDYGAKSWKELGLLRVERDDDVLRCNVNGKPVDFVFDDLLESKEWARRHGEAAVAQCLLMPRRQAKGGNQRRHTSYKDGKCIGITPELCNQISPNVPGGTEYKDNACVFKDAAAVKKWEKTGEKIMDVVDVALVGYFSVLGAAVYGGIKLTSWINEDWQENSRLSSFAKGFAKEASEAVSSGSPEKCAQVIKDWYWTLPSIVDGMDDDQLDELADLDHALYSFLGEERYEAAKMFSGPRAADTRSNIASFGVFVGEMFFFKSGNVGRIRKVKFVKDAFQVNEVGTTARITKPFSGNAMAENVYNHVTTMNLKTFKSRNELAAQVATDLHINEADAMNAIDKFALNETELAKIRDGMDKWWRRATRTGRNDVAIEENLKLWVDYIPKGPSGKHIAGTAGAGVGTYFLFKWMFGGDDDGGSGGVELMGSTVDTTQIDIGDNPNNSEGDK